MTDRRPVTDRRRYRLTLATMLASVMLCASLGLLIGVAAHAQRRSAPVDRVQRARTLLSSWNDLVVSVELQTPLFHELQENLKGNPPHLVYDPRRRELYKQLIAEHQRQLDDLKKMQENDK